MRSENRQGGVERCGALQTERKKRKHPGSKLKPPLIYRAFCFRVETVKQFWVGFHSFKWLEIFTVTRRFREVFKGQVVGKKLVSSCWV